MFAPSIIALFGENSAEEIGVLSLRMHAVSLPLMPVCLITGMLFQAVGQIKKAVVLSSAKTGNIFSAPNFSAAAVFSGTGRGSYTGNCRHPCRRVFTSIFSMVFAYFEKGRK